MVKIFEFKQLSISKSAMHTSITQQCCTNIVFLITLKSQKHTFIHSKFPDVTMSFFCFLLCFRLKTVSFFIVWDEVKGTKTLKKFLLNRKFPI